jgi:hypothetical protein
VIRRKTLNSKNKHSQRCVKSNRSDAPGDACQVTVAKEVTEVPPARVLEDCVEESLVRL